MAFSHKALSLHLPTLLVLPRSQNWENAALVHVYSIHGVAKDGDSWDAKKINKKKSNGDFDVPAGHKRDTS